MKPTEFVDKVILRILKNYKIESDSDMDTIKKEIRRLQKDGYSIAQAYTYYSLRKNEENRK